MAEHQEASGLIKSATEQESIISIKTFHVCEVRIKSDISELSVAFGWPSLQMNTHSTE